MTGGGGGGGVMHGKCPTVWRLVVVGGGRFSYNNEVGGSLCYSSQTEEGQLNGGDEDET